MYSKHEVHVLSMQLCIDNPLVGQPLARHWLTPGQHLVLSRNAFYRGHCRPRLTPDDR